MALTRTALRSFLLAALHEDGAHQDITSRAVLPAPARIRARIIAKSSGVLAGAELTALTFTTLDPSLRCRLHLRSGASLTPGKPILTVEGRARSILAAERTALNLLGHLSGIATLTRAFVLRAKGTRAQILDTRKTLPGLRKLEKSAVLTGGGHNHRLNLAEAILVKTNHLRAARSRTIAQLIARARRIRPKRFVEIEVANLREFHAALDAQPDAILLDNWRLPAIRKAVALRNSPPITQHSSPLLEASGGVTLANVRAIAKTGVDRISVGRLTHSAPSLDISLTVLP